MGTPPKNAEFRFGLAGVFSKMAPDLLKDGQYRYAQNVGSNQEGSLSSRTGPKKVGSLTAAQQLCYHIRKLRVSGGENPLVPATNPRYLGIVGASTLDLYRTPDYNSLTLVASAVDNATGQHWEMADYAAGDTGSPWAYFACRNVMLKDSGLNPYSTLPPWGIQPAHGVCMAAVVTGNVPVVFPYNGSSPITEVQPVTIFLSDGVTPSPTGVADADVVTFSGISSPTSWVVPAVCPTGNGLYYAKVVGYSNSAADPYYAAYGQGAVFALYDSNGQGVPPTASYAQASGVSVAGIAVTGNLQGGAVSSPNGTQPYDWVAVYLEAPTQDEGNPSQTMSANSSTTLTTGGFTFLGVPVAVNGGQAKVLVWGVANTTRFPTINVYRRGGTLTDMLYRLVASVANPGYGGTVTFTDNTADADLVYQTIVETDNDPPVPSTVASPIKGTISAIPANPQYQTATITVTAGAFTAVTPGSTVHILDAATPEDVVAASVTSSSLTAYFQFAHAAGTPVEVDTIMGQSCNLAASIGDQLLVAGDPNNPHMLYKSKAGSPQAFPVGEDAAGAITSQGVGTPANGIVNMCEFRGQVACMNVSSLFEVPVINSSLYQAAEVAKKGLISQSAWCKTESELWFLSNDGVYSWNGGTLAKRTEAIDPIFHNEYYDGISPLDYTNTSALANAKMEYRRGVVRLVYTGIDGNVRTLACEPRYGDRWVLMNDNQGTGPINYVTALYREPDTESLVVALWNSTGAMFGIADACFISGGVNYTSDWWTTNSQGSDGKGIPWDVRLPWFDLGTPAMEKMFEEVWLDLDPQLYTTGGSTITVELLLNYSDTVVDAFNIAIPSGSSFTGRQLVSLLPNLSLVTGSTYQSYGREARAISFHIYGTAYPVQATLDRLIFQYQEVGLLTAGSATDWLDLGNRHDKRLYQMTVVFDTAGTNRKIVLESYGGRDCLTAGTPQVFTLVSPTALNSGRCMKTFPMADPTIGKLFRVRPYSSATEVASVPQSSADLFRIFEVTFPESEEYPPDLCTVTPWEDGGYEYDKYANQIDFEVNTNGVAITVQIQADGANIGPSFTVTATESNRRVNITLPPNLKGKKWRVFVDPTQTAISSGTGMWQLFSHRFGFQKADIGEVQHTFDWDDLGYQFDKRLYTVTIQWDNTGGSAVTMVLDLLSGVSGGTVQSAVATFSLGTAGRSEKTFPLPDGLIAKAVRLYPQTTPLPVGFKSWKYTFQKEEYPADIVAFTKWEDGNYEYDKYLNQIDLEVNTNNVAVTFQAQVDGGTVFTGTAQTTESNRRVNITTPTGLKGKKWRLFIDPSQTALVSGGGMWQLFNHRFAFQKADLGEVQHTFDWDDLGYQQDKRLYTVTIQWDNTGGSSVTMVLDLLSGVNGGTVQSAVATFVLGTAGRSEKTFPLPDGLIAKAIRLYPQTSLPVTFKSWKYNFQKEDYPADIVAFTQWEDGGYEYDKYLNQVDLEVNTNNTVVTFQVQADGATVFTGTVQTTEPNRRVNITVPTALKGKMWRLFVDPTQSALTTGGMWQLFAHRFAFQKADKGEVQHTFDWDDLGHQFDKRLYTVTLQWDNTGGSDVVMVLDLLSGVSGGTVRSSVMTFDLGTAGRSEKTFPLIDGLIAKAIRLYPQGNTIPAGFKNWKYTFQKEDYPADIVAFTQWEDDGYEYDKYANQIDFEVNTNNVAVTVQIQADGANAGPPFSITTTEPNRRVNITLPPNLKGKKWRIFVDPTQSALTTGGGMWQLFSHRFGFQKADKGEVQHTFDWDDLGYPYDKRLYTVTIQWDNTAGTDVVMVLDLLSGIGGGTVQAAVATFDLGTAGRSERTFPLPDGLIAKDVRLYPQTTPLPVGFKSWKYNFQKEDYPPDIVAFTKWEDGGSEYNKYLNQLDIEVNTNNVAVTVQVQADGATVFIFNATATEKNRKINVTIPTGLQGKMWRLFIDPTQSALTTGGGEFQLFNHRFAFQAADKGEVGHTFDWDDLGHPWDKYLRTITVEWDDSSGSNVTLVMDTLSGIGGQTVTPGVASFTLTGGRSKCVFPIAPDTIAKMVRVYPSGGTIPTGFKQWKYKFDFDPYPADIIFSTGWKDAESPNDKNPTWLSIDADTQAVPASVILQNENGTVMTVSHTGSVDNRKKNYAIPVDVFAKMWRLLPTPGTGGKYQQFSWAFERWSPIPESSGADPADVVLWTPWTDFGYPYPKLARNLILTINTGGVACSIALQTQEAGTVQTFSVTTSYTARRSVLPCSPNLAGTQWRLLLTPSVGGLAKLWDWTVENIKEPAAVTQWSSYEQTFGYKFWKIVKQGWWMYTCPAAVTITITSDTGVFTVTLPAHTTRAVERFLLPSVWGAGYNKSKTYSVLITSESPFQFYTEGSGLEWLECGGDRHAAYRQMNFNELMGLGEGAS